MSSRRRAVLMGLTALWCAAAVAAEAPKPGYITGRAVNAAGAPLAGVQIRVGGTTDAGQRTVLNVRTKADGRYQLRLPPGMYSIGTAVWQTNYDGRPYSLPLYLEGEDTSDFDAMDGAVANLTLRTSGKIVARKADSDDSAWFGGTIEVEFVDAQGSYLMNPPEGARITLQLTPRGKLMDGADAAPKSYVRPVTGRSADRFILDVPLASYDAQVTLEAEGRTLPLLVASRELGGGATRTALARTAPIRFAPKSGSAPLLTYSGVEKCVLQVVMPERGTVAAAARIWNVGDAVNALRSPLFGQWHAGKVVEVKDGLYLIKFDAFGTESNEWFDASRLKPL